MSSSAFSSTSRAAVSYTHLLQLAAGVGDEGVGEDGVGLVHDIAAIQAPALRDVYKRQAYTLIRTETAPGKGGLQINDR